MGLLSILNRDNKNKLNENKRMMKLYDDLKNKNTQLMDEKAELEERKVIIIENRRLQDENSFLEEEIKKMKEEMRGLISPGIKFTIKTE